jgi:hypothetical protein
VIWVAISSVILILIQQQSEGVTMVDPEGIEQLKRWMDGFVDDTTAWLNQFCAELLNPAEDFAGTVTDKLQAMAQWWEALLHATGGKLELDKCFYYIMH